MPSLVWMIHSGSRRFVKSNWNDEIFFDMRPSKRQPNVLWTKMGARSLTTLCQVREKRNVEVLKRGQFCSNDMYITWSLTIGIGAAVPSHHRWLLGRPDRTAKNRPLVCFVFCFAHSRHRIRLLKGKTGRVFVSFVYSCDETLQELQGLDPCPGHTPAPGIWKIHVHSGKSPGSLSKV